MAKILLLAIFLLGPFTDALAGMSENAPACAPGSELDAGLCYAKCAAGDKGVGPVCWQNCPAGFRDIGALCTNLDVRAKGSYGRGWGAPMICPPGQEWGGLCAIGVATRASMLSDLFAGRRSRQVGSTRDCGFTDGPTTKVGSCGGASGTPIWKQEGRVVTGEDGAACPRLVRRDRSATGPSATPYAHRGMWGPGPYAGGDVPPAIAMTEHSAAGTTCSPSALMDVALEWCRPETVDTATIRLL